MEAPPRYVEKSESQGSVELTINGSLCRIPFSCSNLNQSEVAQLGEITAQVLTSLCPQRLNCDKLRTPDKADGEAIIREIKKRIGKECGFLSQGGSYKEVPEAGAEAEVANITMLAILAEIRAMSGFKEVCSSSIVFDFTSACKKDAFQLLLGFLD